MVRTTVLLALALSITIGGVALKAAAARQDEDGDDEDENPRRAKARLEKLAARRKALWDQKRYDETGFKRMAPPKAGEWLHRFAERGQTFDDYKKQCSNKRRPGRETIQIRPLGPLGPRAKGAIEPIRKFTEAFFGLTVKVLDERELPKKAYVQKRRQYDEGPIMQDLKKEVPDDALVYCALADKDLFSEGLNYVFGVGSLEDRVGVYSLVRFHEGEKTKETIYRRRAFQLVAHELGHILSIEHCIYYDCVMNGSNSLEESDDAPCHLCPVCQEKLLWNTGGDAKKRHEALAKVYEAEGLEAETKWTRERLGVATKPEGGEKAKVWR